MSETNETVKNPRSGRVDVARISPLQRVLDLVPAKVARGFNVLPISLDDNEMVLCLMDKSNFSLREKMERLLPDYTLSFVESLDEASLKQALRDHYPDMILTGELSQPENLFFYILLRALTRNASDIHISPLEHGARVRLRIDGKLHADRSIPNEVSPELVSYIKVLAKLDIAEKRVSQDGNIDTHVDNLGVSLRVATVPTIYGEHVTLRILSQSRKAKSLDTLESLGMHAKQFDLFARAIHSPNGVVIISGPTGSGKTTTLYAVLRELTKSDTLHIISIEDPVEKPIDNVTQIKVDSKQDRVSFERALRSVLRHDPDVVMIGEVRDGETAATALRSALTGHLVFTTLHTNNAPGILTRLIDLGVPDYLVATTLRLAIAQRLLRKPCRACMSWVVADEKTCLTYGWDSTQPPRVPKVNGCAYCGMKGYSGRTAIYEVMPITGHVRELLLKGKSERELYSHLKTCSPELTLLGDGLAKVLEGETTLEELQATVCEDISDGFVMDNINL